MTLTRLLRLWVQPKARCQYALFISSTQFFSEYSFGKNYKVKFSFDFEIQTKCLIADSAVCCLGPRLGLFLTFFKANSSMAREGVFPTSLCLFSHPISLSRTTHVCQGGQAVTNEHVCLVSLSLGCHQTHFEPCILLEQYLFTNTVFVYSYSICLQIFSQYLFTDILNIQ